VKIAISRPMGPRPKQAKIVMWPQEIPPSRGRARMWGGNNSPAAARGCPRHRKHRVMRSGGAELSTRGISLRRRFSASADGPRAANQAAMMSRMVQIRRFRRSLHFVYFLPVPSPVAGTGRAWRSVRAAAKTAAGRRSSTFVLFGGAEANDQVTDPGADGRTEAGPGDADARSRRE
jgi:hypothetical protein